MSAELEASGQVAVKDPSGAVAAPPPSAPTSDERRSQASVETKYTHKFKIEDFAPRDSSSIQFQSEAYSLEPSGLSPDAPTPDAPIPLPGSYTGHTFDSFKKALRVSAYKSGLKLSFGPTMMNAKNLDRIIEFTVKPALWRGKSRRNATVRITYRAASIVVCEEPEVLSREPLEWAQATRARTEIDFTLVSEHERSARKDSHLLIIPLVKRLNDAMRSEVTVRHSVITQPHSGSSVENVVARLLTKTSILREERGPEELISKLASAFESVGAGPKCYA